MMVSGHVWTPTRNARNLTTCLRVRKLRGRYGTAPADNVLKQAMENFDCVIIGGGIVGLSVAWAALEKNPGLRLTVIEKEKNWAAHQTGRNSGVIHSGIYYKPGSLKARLCREGNRRMVEFCALHGIRYEECGKVIVATTATELGRLENLYERGLANGLVVKKLSASEVKEIEPHVNCLAGIHVPSTGIADFIGVCRKIAELLA